MCLPPPLAPSETRPYPSIFLFFITSSCMKMTNTVLSSFMWVCPLFSSSATSWHLCFQCFTFYLQVFIFPNIILSLREIILPDIPRKHKIFPAYYRRKTNNYTSDCLTRPKSHEKSILCPRIKTDVNCQLEISMKSNDKNITWME